ncbi:HAD family hydrolase [Pleomorphovibrio marinus]|uniref:HAD family hydrolase n=1 Tax=Pleomorphovibrio marinus TaxID=2164132 RepID=UPI000E0C5E29|nr:HAD-IB family phosphatase [Pleomorphovibrio marinus]
MEKDKEEVYVFDVCGTLYHANTTYEFLKYYFIERDKCKYNFIRLSLSLPGRLMTVVLTKLGIKTGIRTFLIGLLKNEKSHEVEEYAKHFVSDYLSSKRLLKTQMILKSAQEQNRRVVLVSASLDPVIKAIADELQVKEYFASTLERSEEGVYSGKLVQDLKGQKLTMIERNFNVQEGEFFVYTDNLDDISLIGIAEKALVLSKKRNLKKWESLLASHQHVDIFHV